MKMINDSSTVINNVNKSSISYNTDDKVLCEQMKKLPIYFDLSQKKRNFGMF
jgi:hypothetical protein